MTGAKAVNTTIAKYIAKAIPSKINTVFILFSF